MRVISGSARGTILHSIDDIKTRPTLDRVKESLFNIISNKIEENTIALDLFAGSGAIGIEFLSRGIKKAYMCDISKDAIGMIEKNLIKTKLYDKAIVINKDYIECLKSFIGKKFDIIFLDPPYKENMTIEAIKKIEEFDLLENNGMIIVETDDEKHFLEEISNIKIKYKIYDKRKYGRAYLSFLNERGK